MRPVLLALALLFAQLGGLLHGLSHYHEDQDRPHATCQLCAAYSVFDHATLGSAPLLLASTHFVPSPLPSPVGIGHRPYLAYHSRAPPADLA